MRNPRQMQTILTVKLPICRLDAMVFPRRSYEKYAPAMAVAQASTRNNPFKKPRQTPMSVKTRMQMRLNMSIQFIVTFKFF